jgi:hypothetical protein
MTLRLETSKSLKTSRPSCFRKSVERQGVDGFSQGRRRGPWPGHCCSPQGRQGLENPIQGTSQGTIAVAPAHQGILVNSWPGALPREGYMRSACRGSKSQLTPQAWPLSGPMDTCSEGGAGATHMQLVRTLSFLIE